MNFKGKNSNFSLRSAIFATLVAAAVFILVLAAACGIAYVCKNPTGAVGICTLSAIVVSGIVGGFAITKMKSKFGMPYAVISATVITAVYLATALIVSGKLYGMHLLNALCYLGAAAFGILLGTRARTKKRRRRK